MEGNSEKEVIKDIIANSFNFCYICCFCYYLFYSKAIPIDFSKVSKVEFYECGDISEKFRLLSLENNEDIALINGIFKMQKVIGMASIILLDVPLDYKWYFMREIRKRLLNLELMTVDL